jgi:acetyltransferase
MPIFVRPLRASDRELEQEFIASLSESTRFFRMFTPLRYLSPQLLDQLMEIDDERRMALVAIARRKDGSEYIVGVARYVMTDQPGTAEIGVTVTDACQRRGIATLLVEALIGFARERGICRLTGLVLPENIGMLALARRMGFSVRLDRGEQLFRIERPLAAANAHPIPA